MGDGVGVGAAVGSAVGCGTSVAGAVSVEQAAKIKTANPIANSAAVVRFPLRKDNVLALCSGSVVLFDMGQVFPHVQHLHCIGRARNPW